MRIRELSNPQVVAIAVGLLGGDAEPVDCEDVAVKANEIAPGRFSWRKYPERIDLAAVGVALRDAKKEKNGGLLVGGNAKGWMLSPQGIVWVGRLGLGDVARPGSLAARRGSIRADQEAERARLRTTRAYGLYVTGRAEDITLEDFRQFARVNEYFQRRARERRYALVENAVVGAEDLSGLWEALKARFSQEVGADGET